MAMDSISKLAQMAASTNKPKKAEGDDADIDTSDGDEDADMDTKMLAKDILRAIEAGNAGKLDQALKAHYLACAD